MTFSKRQKQIIFQQRKKTNEENKIGRIKTNDKKGTRTKFENKKDNNKQENDGADR